MMEYKRLTDTDEVTAARQELDEAVYKLDKAITERSSIDYHYTAVIDAVNDLREVLHDDIHALCYKVTAKY